MPETAGHRETATELRKSGLQFLSNAIQCEEDDNQQLARSLYKMAADQLSEGLRRFQEQHSEEGGRHGLGKAEEEMLWGLGRARDRLEHLKDNKKPEEERSRMPGPSFRASSSSPRPQAKRPTTKKPELFMTELEKFLSHSIIDRNELKKVGFSDVVGQAKAKKALGETVVLPALRPELFSGLRTPAKGLLLFGPPGNGKTLLARALAGEMRNATLFSITASSLTSKFVGEGEKLVKTLFEMARRKSPSIVFIDEVDSILCSRKDSDHEASRRLKTEFFASFDGLSNDSDKDRILLVGATNRPFELDDAALRRFTKRIYIPMPDLSTRRLMLVKLLSVHDDPLTGSEIEKMAKATEGYSCSDVTNLAREAALCPLRECPEIEKVRVQDIRTISFQDFRCSLAKVRTSVAIDLIERYRKWNVTFGDVS